LLPPAATKDLTAAPSGAFYYRESARSNDRRLPLTCHAGCVITTIEPGIGRRLAWPYTRPVSG